jgi:hypothetical protein
MVPIQQVVKAVPDFVITPNAWLGRPKPSSVPTVPGTVVQRQSQSIS